MSFPLRNNSAISIIPKTSTNPPTPTPRLISRPGSGAGFKQQIDKDVIKRPRNISTPITKPNTSQANLSHHLPLQRLPKSKHDSMDHSSLGENSNSSDSQPRTDQRVEEVRLEDIVAEASSTSDYSPTNPNRTINSDIESGLQRLCETKTQDYGTNPMPTGHTIQNIQSSSHIESEGDIVLKGDNNHVKPLELIEPERSTQSINYGHKYSNQPGNNDHHLNDEIIPEESIVTALPLPSSIPLTSQIKQQPQLPQDIHSNQQLLTPQSPYSQQTPEIPKPLPDTNTNRPIVPASTNTTNRASIKERSLDGQENTTATAAASTVTSDPHGISQAYPYAQYPRYYDYADPRSQSLTAPYGSYFPSVGSHSNNSRVGGDVTKSQPADRAAKLPEERLTIPTPATYSQSTGAIASTPSVDTSEVKPQVVETAAPPVTISTTTQSRIDPHLSTAFSHPASSRYTGTYPPTPYDPYSQHYPATPNSSAAYPPTGNLQ